MEKSAEINGRIQEIQTIAAGLPHGGDIEKLRQELTRLASWANQTLLFLGRVENEPCQNCTDCDCQK